jgi:aminopeptidase N
MYLDEEHRPDAKIAFATRLQELLLAAEPASDHQLALVRSFASVATTPEQLELVAALLDGAREVPGLVVDTDLRWALLRRLVAAGVRGDDAIDAELDRDRTASGQRQAAAVRAARPTAEAKAAAWDAVVVSDALPNALQTATIAGFMDPDHRELVRPFVDRYFESVGQVWSERTAEMAANIVIGMYPAVLVEPQLVERTNAYLAEQNPPGPLARLLAEGRDGVERALRCQDRDRNG